MSTELTGRDLRDMASFTNWVKTLPAALREVLQHAAPAYLGFDDAIDIVLPHSMEQVLRRSDVFDLTIQHVASFYDRNRSQWIMERTALAQGCVPLNVVMPRVRFAVAPRMAFAH